MLDDAGGVCNDLTSCLRVSKGALVAHYVVHVDLGEVHPYLSGLQLCDRSARGALGGLALCVASDGHTDGNERSGSVEVRGVTAEVVEVPVE